MRHILESGDIIKLDIMEIRHTINSKDLPLIWKTNHFFSYILVVLYQIRQTS